MTNEEYYGRVKAKAVELERVSDLLRKNAEHLAKTGQHLYPPETLAQIEADWHKVIDDLEQLKKRRPSPF